jgi:hypothetical protein
MLALEIHFVAARELMKVLSGPICVPVSAQKREAGSQT